MAQRCAMANQQGGVGNTTTTAALGAAFAERGQRVLVVDLDPQAGLTVSLGMDPHTLDKTIYYALREEEALARLIVPTNVRQMDLVPTNLDLAGAEAELIGEIGWDRTLKDALDRIQDRDDWMLLDGPPSLGVLTTNALVAAEIVIVPLQKIIAKVNRKANPHLRTRILRTMDDGRTIHDGDQVFQTFMKRTMTMADAAVEGEPIVRYGTDSEAAHAYRELAQEIASRWPRPNDPT